MSLTIQTLEQPIEKLPYAKPVVQELGDLKTHTLASPVVSDGVDPSSPSN